MYRSYIGDHHSSRSTQHPQYSWVPLLDVDPLAQFCSRSPSSAPKILYLSAQSLGLACPECAKQEKRNGAWVRSELKRPPAAAGTREARHRTRRARTSCACSQYPGATAACWVEVPTCPGDWRRSSPTRTPLQPPLLYAAARLQPQAARSSVTAPGVKLSSHTVAWRFTVLALCGWTSQHSTMADWFTRHRPASQSRAVLMDAASAMRARRRISVPTESKGARLPAALRCVQPAQQERVLREVTHALDVEPSDDLPPNGLLQQLPQVLHR